MDDVETMIENLIERLIQGSYNTGKGFSADKPVLERRGQASRGAGPGWQDPRTTSLHSRRTSSGRYARIP